ncbi:MULTISPECIES: hypothetical protein [Bacillus]|uniref:hypothetical protein n=1 Tax=Bacillus TaxID=1386 RepID=UPI00057C2A29|nr:MULTISPECIES: hypothetical protein [Bacillus]PJY99253.1 hypothetical protein CPT06_17750 [Bacillus vallismortis]
MKLLAAIASMLICLILISISMDILQNFTLQEAIYNNFSTFRMTTFAEWVLLFAYALLLIKKGIVMYHSKKKNPKAGR